MEVEGLIFFSTSSGLEAKIAVIRYTYKILL